MVQRRLVRTTLAAVGLLLQLACGSSPPAPTPVLSITCPADVSAVAPDGEAIDVAFPAATAAGGAPPLSLTCAPPSGSEFPVGDTPVACTVRDSEQRAASCQFRVRVTAPPRLRHTRFLAFGDSLTRGTLSQTVFPLLVGPVHSYPARLSGLLTAKYTADDVVVINEGWPGEDTNEGRLRLPGVLDTYDADVLLLLEGVNDILQIPRETQLANLRTMVLSAQSRGMEVLIATLTPVKSPRGPLTQAAIVDLNEGIVELAEEEDLGRVVDLYEAFEGRPQLLGDDGLHPTEEGYRVVAQTFADEIERRFEEPATALRALRGRTTRPAGP
jgi:acyl-CoA thioesterase-1